MALNYGRCGSTSRDLNSWISQPCFQRYWNHYQQVIAWSNGHKQAMVNAANKFAKVVEPSNSSLKHCPTCTCSINDEQKKLNRAARRRKRFGRKSPLPNANDEKDDKSSNSSPDYKKIKVSIDTKEIQAEPEEKDVEMHITEDFLEFFAQSLKHKEELKGKRGEFSHINLEDAISTKHQSRITTSPPAQRPGAQRTSDMKILYGSGAAMIHGMETAMQLTYDRNCDIYQPKPWPNIPFAIKFE